VDIVFVAHTTDAWEFSEADFFKVTGSGGTVTSAGLGKVREIIQERFDPSTYNVYLFYASDGDNASDDRPKAGEELESIAKAVRFTGYVEISAGARSSQSETTQLFQAIADAGLPCGRYSITGPDDVAAAVRHFFTAEAQSAAQSAHTGGAP
jgi:uncharacterized sporulation protein YeaH/YhbH (DUF444 family)